VSVPECEGEVVRHFGFPPFSQRESSAAGRRDKERETKEKKKMKGKFFLPQSTD
jgi:hypothetical protein